MVALAAASLAVLVYTYAGYPVLVAVLARLVPLRVRVDPSYTPTVSVCIAALDAARYLPAKFESLIAQDYPSERLEVVVYSDGSTDGTVDLVREWGARDPRFKLLVGERRAGKPNALNRLREAATGEILVMTDARQPLSPNAVRALVSRLADPGVGVVAGNLEMRGQTGAGVYWRYEAWIRRNEQRFRGLIGIAGALYAIRRADLSPVPLDLILDDMWVPLQLRMQGRRIVLAEEAVAYDEAFDDEREFGRKVRTLAGNFQLFAKMPGLLVPFVNPSWFEVVSHKVMRLLCPYALVGLLVASIGWLARPTELWAMRVLAGGQALFLIMALVGARGGKWTGVARTFVVLNLAAVVGLWRHLRGSQKVAW